jgi:hypothetical protein
MYNIKMSDNRQQPPLPPLPKKKIGRPRKVLTEEEKQQREQQLNEQKKKYTNRWYSDTEGMRRKKERLIQRVKDAITLNILTKDDIINRL